MKDGVVGSAPHPYKRRWRRHLVLALIALGFLSLFMPLVVVVRTGSVFPADKEALNAEYNFSGYIETVVKSDGRQFNDAKIDSGDPYNTTEIPSPIVIRKNDLPSPLVDEQKSPLSSSRKKEKPARNFSGNGLTDDEWGKGCKLKFGSYCFWSAAHRVEMKVSILKKLTEQLFLARAYHPSISKLKSQRNLSMEINQNIEEYERALTDASGDADLSPNVVRNIKKMDTILKKAKSCFDNCNVIDNKLRQILDTTEEEAYFHMQQSAFLHHLNVYTMPKSLHCLLLRLTVEYFGNSSMIEEKPNTDNINSSGLQHYVIFSKTLLASMATINSTVMNAQESKKLVFHVVTDGLNYYAMKFWFSKNSYKEAVIHVLNIDDLNLSNSLTLESQYFSLTEEFRVSFNDIGQPPAEFTTAYLSVFGHAHFLLPDIFKNLKKVILLDDDVVVQQDLSSLWNLNMEGKVNAAMLFCGIKLDLLKKYLGRKGYRNDSCAWMSGLNIVDLEKWREHNVTERYRALVQKLPSETETSWRAAALPTSYLVFEDLLYPLDKSWVLSGLGVDYDVSKEAILKAPVLHFNGDMKPWLQLGIHRYRKYWKKYLPRNSSFIDECKVNSFPSRISGDKHLVS